MEITTTANKPETESISTGLAFSATDVAGKTVVLNFEAATCPATAGRCCCAKLIENSV